MDDANGAIYSWAWVTPPTILPGLGEGRTHYHMLKIFISLSTVPLVIHNGLMIYNVANTISNFKP